MFFRATHTIFLRWTSKRILVFVLYVLAKIICSLPRMHAVIIVLSSKTTKLSETAPLIYLANRLYLFCMGIMALRVASFFHEKCLFVVETLANGGVWILHGGEPRSPSLSHSYALTYVRIGVICFVRLASGSLSCLVLCVSLQFGYSSAKLWKRNIIRSPMGDYCSVRLRSINGRAHC